MLLRSPCPRCKGKLFATTGQFHEQLTTCINCGYDGPTIQATDTLQPAKGPRLSKGWHNSPKVA